MRRHSGFSPATLVVAAATGLTACADSSVGPPELAILEANPPTLELELGDSTLVVVTARDAAGVALSGISIAWSSSDASVARVSANGLVTGVAAGTATVIASAQGASATVAVTVHPWNIAENVVVIDSTVLMLTSDSTEAASGRYRFQVVTGAPRTFAPGEIIVGTQWPGFLRRVTSASTSGGEITLETESAALNEVIEAGSFETRIDLLFAPPSPAGARGVPGAALVRWGEPVVHYLAPGFSVGAAGLDISGTDICTILGAGGGSCPAGISKLEIKQGILDFNPNLDFAAAFSGFKLQDFRGIVDGTLDLRFTGLLEVESSATLLSPFKIVDVTRPFYFQVGWLPVLGYVELTLHAGLEIEATAKGSVEAGYVNTHTVQVGAKWNQSGGWQGVFQSQRQFDASEPDIGDGTLSAQIDLELKLSFKPEFKIIFYGVAGPFANVEPYGEVTLSYSTQTCGLDSKAGVDSEIGFTIPFLDPSVGNFSKQQQLGTWQGRSWTCPLGSLDVSTITNGQDPDPDGYTVMVDSLDMGQIGSTDQKTVHFVQIGPRDVRLEGVAPNCVVQPPHPQSVSVARLGLHPVQFTIQCAAKSGDLEVAVATTGQNLDPDGYTVTVDGTSSQAVGINGQVAFSGLAAGPHSVALSGIASNCTVTGSNPQTATVATGAPARVTFNVNCSAGQLNVTVPTSGPPSTTNWVVILDGSMNTPISPNGSVLLTVQPGPHTVELSGVSSNCQVSGANPQNVQAPASGVLTVTFSVTCQASGLTVTVVTAGDPSPATSYTARIVGGTSQTVGVNGSVTFSNVAQGSHNVQLDGVPAHCTVQGQNPRSVSAPGATTFDVVCQQPVACTNPPTPSLRQFVEVFPQDGGSGTPQVTAHGWREHSVTATVTAPAVGLSPNVSAELESLDHIFLVPVDAARAGEYVRLHYRVTGNVAVTGERVATFQASWASARAIPRAWEVATWSQTDPPSLTFDEVVVADLYLANWSPFGPGAYLQVVARDGQSGSATASIKLENLIEVRDVSGNVVPIAQVCTASGTTY